MKRRTLLGAAWVAPVIAMGVSAPAASASEPPIRCGKLIWDNNQPFTVDHYKTLTFNYGFRSNWDSAGVAVCYVQLFIDNYRVGGADITLDPGRSADRLIHRTAPLTPGHHTWAILITAPGFNALQANGSFTTP